MGIKAHWYMPTGGDSRRFMDHANIEQRNQVGDPLTGRTGGPTYRPPHYDYLRLVAKAADMIGIDSMLVPTSPTCQDPWLSAAAMIPETTRLKFMVAYRPSMINPVWAANMCRTFQEFSGGRLVLNLTPGRPGPSSLRWGDAMTKEESLEQCEEYIAIMRGAWSGEPFDFKGRYHSVEKADVGVPPKLPTIYFGGSSEGTLRWAAEHADVYLSMGETAESVGRQVARVREMAAEKGREIRAGIALNSITRDTDDDAAEAANDKARGVTDESLAEARRLMATHHSSPGMVRILEQSSDKLSGAMIGPNLWMGAQLARRGMTPALVGSHETLVKRIEEYIAVGIDEIIFGGAPELEEMLWFGEGIMPLLRERGLLDED